MISGNSSFIAASSGADDTLISKVVPLPAGTNWNDHTEQRAPSFAVSVSSPPGYWQDTLTGATFQVSPVKERSALTTSRLHFLQRRFVEELKINDYAKMRFIDDLVANRFETFIARLKLAAVMVATILMGAL